MLFPQRQTGLRDANMRLDTHQRYVRRDLLRGLGKERGKGGGVHPEESLVEVGCHQRVRGDTVGVGEERLELGDGGAEFGAGLGGYVDWDGEGVREAEEFGGC